MKPDQSVISSVSAQGTSVRVLAGEKEYLIYIHQEMGNQNKEDLSVDFMVQLEKGNYQGQWIDTKTGARSELKFSHEGGEATISTPEFAEDIALILRKK